MRSCLANFMDIIVIVALLLFVAPRFELSTLAWVYGVGALVMFAIFVYSNVGKSTQTSISHVLISLAWPFLATILITGVFKRWLRVET
jgi:hypothetical protein